VLARLQAGLGGNWRSQLALARAFPAFPPLLPGDAVHDHWAPCALGLLVSGGWPSRQQAAAGAHGHAQLQAPCPFVVDWPHAAPSGGPPLPAKLHAMCQRWLPGPVAPVAGAASVKPAAAAGLAAFLRAARRERPRTELYCRTVRELARGRGCWARLGWLEFAGAAARRFSARFFKARAWRLWGRHYWSEPASHNLLLREFCPVPARQRAAVLWPAQAGQKTRTSVSSPPYQRANPCRCGPSSPRPAPTQ
jgi:hypothetical protein